MHLTADGHVVCCHNPTVDQTSNGTGAIAQMTLAELRRLDFHSWKTSAIPAEYGDDADQFITLPELLDLLAEAGRDVELALELKHPKTDGGTIGHDPQLDTAALEVLRSRGWEPATSEISGPTTVGVTFMSFSAESLRSVRSREPELPAARLCAVFGFTEQARPLVERQEVGLAGPRVEYVRRYPRRVRGWAAAGMPARVWTVDDVEDARFLLALGAVEGITSNYPGRILAAFGHAEGA